MDERWIKTLCLSALLVTVSGCAQSQFRAGDLPRQYTAASIRNYSTVDLTPFAKAIASGNTIEPGDTLQVNLNTGTQTEDSNLVWKVSVDESGQTSLPNIGAVKLAGLSRAQAEKTIVQASLQRDVFLTPTVEISVDKQNTRTIQVSGAVTKPGPITIRGENVTLADVLVRAGGLTDAASGQVSVTGAEGSSAANLSLPNAIQSVGSTTDYGFKAITVSLSTTPLEQFGEIAIPDGSVVHVEELGPRPIKVMGVIRDQAVQVPSGENIRLLDAIALAGGQTYSNWISDRITVIRRTGDGRETVTIRASIRRARNDNTENILLAPYDVVQIEENVFTFTLSTLSGLFGAGVSAAQLGAY